MFSFPTMNQNQKQNIYIKQLFKCFILYLYILYLYILYFIYIKKKYKSLNEDWIFAGSI